VVILQGGNVIKNINITDPAAREKFIGDLNRKTNYIVEVYARNYVFEGDASHKNFKTNPEGANSYSFVSRSNVAFLFASFLYVFMPCLSRNVGVT